MEIVKEPQVEQVKESQDTVNSSPEQKKEPVYYVMSEEVISNVLAFLKKLPWETSNDVLVYINKNVTPVKVTQTLNTQADENQNKESLEK